MLFCTVFYLLVAAGAIGAMGADPVRDAAGAVLAPGSAEMAAQCPSIVAGGVIEPLVCSKEALAHVLRTIGYQRIGDLMGVAAFIALPSVVLMMMFGQTRIFFVMARDGLLPERLSEVHPKFRTPHIVTAFTGIVVTLAAAFLPVGKLADYSNSGTLFAFAMVALVGAGAAQEGSGPPPAVPHAGGGDHRAAGDHRLHRALSVPADCSRSWC